MTAPQIIATIGHGSHHDDLVRAIVDAGADVLRYNAATMKTLDETVERIVGARRALADRPTSPGPAAPRTAVPIMVDLPFPRRKQRLHTFRGAEHDVPGGKTFRFVCRHALQTGPDHVLVEVPTFDGVVTPGEVFVIGDGELAFRVTEVVDGDRFDAVALTKWYLSDGKSIHLARVPTRAVDAARYVAEVAAAFGGVRPEYLAFSFVSDARDMTQIRSLLAPYAAAPHPPANGPDVEAGWRPKLVAKIETSEAVRNIDEILDASDLVLFARGDLAIQAPYELLGIYQKHVVARARARDVPVIIATQVLETTMTRYVPNRSEVLDLTNLVLDGAWGVLLAKETSAPGNPVYPVTVAKRIIDQVVASGLPGKPS
ncbi:pyruvate kinase [Micromonospora sp. NBC_01655]|uniref:pyruvate kinase n=1 Tax=Micromonospora sp. NBC_01655 TaxID=2975983 RepID=UPI0022584B1D|nr:pyruvate kinase [Micromonospora sp. NBC_01655]MCX4474625.1 pyruvate kinase [Micromonospora sp. NBC_01655]